MIRVQILLLLLHWQPNIVLGEEEEHVTSDAGCPCTSACDYHWRADNQPWCYVEDCSGGAGNNWDTCQNMGTDAIKWTDLEWNDCQDAPSVEMCNCGGGSVDDYTMPWIYSKMAVCLVNKLRAVTQVPPLTWHCDLVCQAEHSASRCSMENSRSFEAQIPAAENIAKADGPDLAIWMWFSIYGDSAGSMRDSEFGHFTAMMWRTASIMGCGYCAESKIMVCQFATEDDPEHPPNCGDPTRVAHNSPFFYGANTNYCQGGMTNITEIRQTLVKVRNAGIEVGQALRRLDAEEGCSGTGRLFSNYPRISEYSAPRTRRPAILVALVMACVATVAIALFAKRSLRNRRKDWELESVIDVDAEGLMVASSDTD